MCRPEYADHTVHHSEDVNADTAWPCLQFLMAQLLKEAQVTATM